MEKLKNEVRTNWAFCSVDAGGEKLARVFADSFGSPLVVAHKQRDYSKKNKIESVHILSAEPLEGKNLWIVDDMIDTAGSVETLIRALAPLKPKEINIITVHAIFSPPATERLDALIKEGLLNRIIATDTVCAYSKKCDSITLSNLEVVPSADLSAKIIKTIICNESMSKLLRQFNAEIYLSDK
jgi:ribose-phosphate pyrophosphokinase